jgi:hypothetical protein
VAVALIVVTGLGSEAHAAELTVGSTARTAPAS